MKYNYVILIAMVVIITLLTSCAKRDEQLIIDSEQLTINGHHEQDEFHEPDEQNEPDNALSDYFLLPYNFTATDLYGNIVTAETLGEKRAFFVHLWATWCGPCVRGMPDLAEISRNYADDVGFIGLVSDFDNSSGAINIIESAGVPSSFVMLNADEASLSHLREMVRTGFVPASVIITKDNHNPEPLSDRNYTEHLDEVLS